jgi:hypothetical protein
MHTIRIGTAVALAAATPIVHSQQTPFQTPGMPQTPSTGAQASRDESQASRFTSGFNPAFSFVIDGFADYVHTDAPDEEGLDLKLGSLEIAAQAWVDPKAWAYFVAAAEEESLNVEEAAIHYVGLGGNSTIRAGRFFIDFGKQMQGHVHELRTTERPLVLRAYLGPEVKGDGLQWDDWTSAGDSGVVRWSLGAFSSLLPEEQDFVDENFERTVAERKDVGDLNLTARLTGFRDVGEHGVLQLGTSWRSIPNYSVEDVDTGLTASDLDSHVLGLDLTYGWTGDTGLKRWTFGTEALWSGGDSGFSLLDPDGIPQDGDEDLVVQNDTLFGGYAFAEYGWDAYHSVGVQYSQAQITDDLDAQEYDIHYTRNFSEFHRLRFTVAETNVEEGDDSTRFLVQYTAFVGAHGHGVNW